MGIRRTSQDNTRKVKTAKGKEWRSLLTSHATVYEFNGDISRSDLNAFLREIAPDGTTVVPGYDPATRLAEIVQASRGIWNPVVVAQRGTPEFFARMSLGEAQLAIELLAKRKPSEALKWAMKAVDSFWTARLLSFDLEIRLGAAQIRSGAKAHKHDSTLARSTLAEVRETHPSKSKADVRRIASKRLAQHGRGYSIRTLANYPVPSGSKSK